MPIVVVENTLSAAATKVSAQLTFDSSGGTNWYYNTSDIQPGRRPADRPPGHRRRLARDRAIRLLGPGRRLRHDQHHHHLERLGHRHQRVGERLRRRLDARRPRADHLGDGRCHPQPGRRRPQPLVHRQLRRSGGGTYTDPPGEFSTLVKKNGDGTYTDTLTDGTQIKFNSGGYETSIVDLNGNHTTYSYNGSNQLTSIKDHVRQFHNIHLQRRLPPVDQRPRRPDHDLHELRRQPHGSRASRRQHLALHL